MAVLKSPRNNKNKRCWAERYVLAKRCAPHPSLVNLTPTFSHRYHLKLSIKRLDQASDANMIVNSTPTLARTALPFTKFDTSALLPHGRYFRNEGRTRGLFYPLVFNSII